MSVANARNGQDHDTADYWTEAGENGTIGDSTCGAGNTRSTAVDLASFEARWDGTAVKVLWETHTEVDHEGFHLWRAESIEEGYARITPALIPSEGGEIWGATYTFEDVDVVSTQTYHYKLEVVSIYGESNFHGPAKAKAAGGLCFFRALMEEKRRR